ncbi:MAG: deoxyribose-phosphate aldolase [Mycobacterium sp.]|jgi:deoxyribose-phosphate aldolase|nr:deoxyribose-phosphate aldolase [Mycobacterium sp.]
MALDARPTVTAVARMIDHTLLRPEATPADVNALVDEAIALGTYSVCVSPSMLPVAIPDGADLKVAAVCGFPSGKHASAIKAAEAAAAVAAGADEIDMVIDIGAAKAGSFDLVEADIAAVRRAVPDNAVLKVIIESAALTDAEILAVCRAAIAARADFVKTSTGFHPSGGASVHAVALMHEAVGGAGLGVKASGGVRTLDQARAMIEAGATRLGVSGSRALLTASDDQPSGTY